MMRKEKRPPGPFRWPPPRAAVAVSTVAGLLLLATAAVGQQEEPGTPAGPVALRQMPATFVPQAPPELELRVVESAVREPHVERHVPLKSETLGLKVTELPGPARSGDDEEEIRRLEAELDALGDDELLELARELRMVPTKNLTWTFDTTDYDTNATHTGTTWVPPDSHAAASTSHVVNVTNVTIRFHTRTGTLQFDDALANFFAPLGPATLTFDPKVLYDQYAKRFVVLTLEKTDAPNTSQIFVAVSDDADPNGLWTMAAVNAVTTINGAPHWADYPGLAVDEEAVYVTTNMYPFGGVTFGGTRLWILDKSFYSGWPLTVSVVDPAPPGGTLTAGTMQPAHVYGTPPVGNVGTWLTLYQGLTLNGNEYLQVIRVDNPLGTPALTGNYLNVGDVETLAGPIPSVPQTGTGYTVDAGDRRTLDAVWRGYSLWVTSTVDPRPPDVNKGQATAIWWQVDTSVLGSPALADSGLVGGEDIASGTHTFYASLAVNGDGDVAVGFSASAPTIHPGSYFTSRQPTDPPGTVRASQTLRAGLDVYVRRANGVNRWGDYSAVALDPLYDCFWIYNQHALAHDPAAPAPDQGRWGTAVGFFCSCVGDESTLDWDYDGICGNVDNCAWVSNPSQSDADFDGVGDVCDNCPVAYNPTQADSDFDTVGDACDICPGSDDRIDTDFDGTPDGCDVCPGSDDRLDGDGDGVPNGCDLCPIGDDAADADGDGVPDACDLCPIGDDAADADGDGTPDACDVCPGGKDSRDSDGDGIPDDCDPEPGNVPVPGEYVYSVDFVCGYQSSTEGNEGYEPVVKVANYATKLDVYNYKGESALLSGQVHDMTFMTWTGAAPPQSLGATALVAGRATLIDCTTIFQLVNGPPPLLGKPFVNGMVTVRSDVPLVVWATKSAEVCASLVTWDESEFPDPVIVIGPDGLPFPTSLGDVLPPLVPSLVGCSGVIPQGTPQGPYLGPAGAVTPGLRSPGMLSEDDGDLFVSGVDVSNSLDYERVEGVFIPEG